MDNNTSGYRSLLNENIFDDIESMNVDNLYVNNLLEINGTNVSQQLEVLSSDVILINSSLSVIESQIVLLNASLDIIQEDINTINNSLILVNERINQSDASILDNASNIGANSIGIATNGGLISFNTSNINNNSTLITANQGGLAYLSPIVGNNSTSIGIINDSLGLINQRINQSDASIHTIDKLTTNGDILYYNNGYQRLGIGSNDQVLKINSGLPSWQDEDASVPDPLTVGHINSTSASITNIEVSKFNDFEYYIESDPQNTIDGLSPSVSNPIIIDGLNKPYSNIATVGGIVNVELDCLSYTTYRNMTIYLNSSTEFFLTQTDSGVLVDCVFENVTFESTYDTIKYFFGIRGITFRNCTFTVTHPATYSRTSNYFEDVGNCVFENCTFEIDGTTYITWYFINHVSTPSGSYENNVFKNCSINIIGTSSSEVVRDGDTTFIDSSLEYDGIFENTVNNPVISYGTRTIGDIYTQNVYPITSSLNSVSDVLSIDWNTTSSCGWNAVGITSGMTIGSQGGTNWGDISTPSQLSFDCKAGVYLLFLSATTTRTSGSSTSSFIRYQFQTSSSGNGGIVKFFDGATVGLNVAGALSIQITVLTLSEDVYYLALRNRPNLGDGLSCSTYGNITMIKIM